jgi:hypothetical protein
MLSVRQHKGRSIGRWNVLLLIGLLGIGIVLQILGAPLAFWDLDGSSDPVASAQLEGFSIMSREPDSSQIFQWVSSFDTAYPAYRFSAPQVFFHPPLAIV